MATPLFSLIMVDMLVFVAPIYDFLQEQIFYTPHVDKASPRTFSVCMTLLIFRDGLKKENMLYFFSILAIQLMTLSM